MPSISCTSSQGYFIRFQSPIRIHHNLRGALGCGHMARTRCTKCLCKDGFNLRLSRLYQHICFALKFKTTASQQ